VQYELLDGDAAGDGRVRLYYNSVVLASSLNAADVLDQMLWHINAESARRTGEFVLVHAGAVAVPGGAGLIIPGVSGTGKSTLVSGLLHAGFGYFSDEAAAIDPIERQLHSYPKAVTLKDRTVFETYPELPPAGVRPEYVRNHWYIVPEEIRPDIMAPPAPVGHVVLSRFEPGAPTTIELASRAEAAAAVGRSIINIGRYKSRVLPLLADLVAGARCYSLRSGDLRSAVDAVVAATTS
ncbi:MAG: hypothetical protein HKN91_05750, partial [Acidimicrobiia bacterium]|nr:hypothetical protein [Acidimicrobiia bacterium]